MTRRETLKRIVIGVPFLILYAFVLFPAIFAFSIVVAAVDGGWRLLTGEGTRLTDVSGRLWDWNGSNARHILTSEGEFELLP